MSYYRASATGKGKCSCAGAVVAVQGSFMSYEHWQAAQAVHNFHINISHVSVLLKHANTRQYTENSPRLLCCLVGGCVSGALPQPEPRRGLCTTGHPGAIHALPGRIMWNAYFQLAAY